MRTNPGPRDPHRGTPLLPLALLAGLAACSGGGGGSATSPTPTPSAPTAVFTFSPAAPLTGQSVSFTDASTGGPTSWSWSFGDGSTSTAQSPTHTFTSAGTYAVTLTAANAGGSNVATRTVAVTAAPTAPVAGFTFAPTTPTVSQSVQFTDTSTGTPTSWAWTFGDGATSTLQNPTHAFATSGAFTVSLTATNAGGSHTATRTVTVATSGTTTQAAFTYSPTPPTTGRSTLFNDTSTGSPTAWSWSFGDGGTSTSQHPTHAYTTAGTFTVSLKATGAGGASTTSQTLTVGTGVTRTVGLMTNTSKAYNGYLLFAPKQNTMTYLIDNEGRVLHSWTASKYPPGQSVYLLENGHLLRSCMTKGQLSSGGGEGGRVEEYDWDGNLVWELDFSTATYMQHHDIRRLPNGNILMLVIEKKTYAECLAAGFNPAKFQPEIAQKGMMLPDYVVEIQPDYAKGVGGTVVWEWHTWDHLVQDFDATKANYGVVKAHPELVSTGGDLKNLPAFWNHMNSIDYNPALDQIAMSVRGNSEVWIIDHSTTTAEAKGHTGGKRGKGGDLLYRWGNPITYGAGTASDQRYFQQHDVEWVRPGYPGAGNLTCFNNGLGRGDYSTVDEFTPAMDASGNYTLSVGTSLPANFTWTYQGTTANPMYSENISGAHRLSNGNTIICSGTTGLFLEVTSAKEIVWKYICPVDQFGPMTQGAAPLPDPARKDETMNSVFRVYKYPVDYAAFQGRTLTPGRVVEN